MWTFYYILANAQSGEADTPTIAAVSIITALAVMAPSIVEKSSK